MRLWEIVARLTGLSTPVFGVSWDPPETEVEVAGRVIAYLEDRRVLYNPGELEVPEHCVESVLDIRRALTQELGKLDRATELAESLRAMRAACRKFINSVWADGTGREIIRFAYHRGHWASWQFNSALGELRGVFGVHVARLAAQHGLDVEDDLAAILPAADEEAESGWRRGKRLDQLKVPDVQELIGNVREGRTIEFKRDLPGRKKEDPTPRGATHP